MLKPIIGISMGDPAGIGPEIIVKALLKKMVYKQCKPVVVGDARVIQQAVDFLNVTLKVNSISNIRDVVPHAENKPTFDKWTKYRE